MEINCVDCPKCGGNIPEQVRHGELFKCSNCASTLVWPDSQSKLVISFGVNLCPDCGVDNEQECKSCRNCGTPLNKICPSCKAIFYVGDNFCPNGHYYEQEREKHEKANLADVNAFLQEAESLALEGRLREAVLILEEAFIINPSRFSTFIGQEEIKHSLTTMIIAANKTYDPIHHLLLSGQPGMGKVTLAKIMATEYGVNFKIASGKTIEKVKDLEDIFFNLYARDFLIIEQIESIRKQTLEVLITAMTNFSFDVDIGKGASARNIKLKLPHFTVVGTTSNPLQVDKRLGSLMFAFNFNSYNTAEVGEILSLFVKRADLSFLRQEVFVFLAELSNGCPEDAFLGLKKLLEYKLAYSGGQITPTIASIILKDLRASLNSKNNSQLLGRQLVSDDVKTFVWQRDGGHCVKCGSQENLEYDHIISISKGGSNTARNIQLLCKKCNRSKSSNIV